VETNETKSALPQCASSSFHTYAYTGKIIWWCLAGVEKKFLLLFLFQTWPNSGIRVLASGFWPSSCALDAGKAVDWINLPVFCLTFISFGQVGFGWICFSWPRSWSNLDQIRVENRWIRSMSQLKMYPLFVAS
jgi:hypothetical protein